MKDCIMTLDSSCCCVCRVPRLRAPTPAGPREVRFNAQDAIAALSTGEEEDLKPASCSALHALGEKLKAMIAKEDLSKAGSCTAVNFGRLMGGSQDEYGFYLPNVRTSPVWNFIITFIAFGTYEKSVVVVSKL